MIYKTLRCAFLYSYIIDLFYYLETFCVFVYLGDILHLIFIQILKVLLFLSLLLKILLSINLSVLYKIIVAELLQLCNLIIHNTGGQ